MITGALRDAAAIVRSAGSFVVSGHVGPDGDALGSALAFAHAARSNGKEAVVAFGNGFELPDQYSFLDASPLVPLSDLPADPEVVVIFDVGVASRLGDLAEIAARAGKLIVVDHHPSPEEGFGDVQVVDPTAGAAAQLCAMLIDELGWEVDETIGQCLLTGIVTDTGRYQYSSTDGDILRVAARLLDAGVRPEVIGQAMYESVPFGYLKVAAAVLGRAELDEDLGLIWSLATRADLESAGIRYDDTDPLIDDLRIAREAGVAVLLKETPEGFKASLRSRGEVDVGSIARREGGGGHHNAAGFTSSDPVEEIIERVRASLRG